MYLAIAMIFSVAVSVMYMLAFGLPASIPLTIVTGGAAGAWAAHMDNKR